ncbi:hypothetical protein BWI15_17960 [Kribbella sp. ALI-6-A]|nr:hypothetical protein BWI15_17960 [Kribbella sp. ALI-6-A]
MQACGARDCGDFIRFFKWYANASSSIALVTSAVMRGSTSAARAKKARALVVAVAPYFAVISCRVGRSPQSSGWSRLRWACSSAGSGRRSSPIVIPQWSWSFDRSYSRRGCGVGFHICG